MGNFLSEYETLFNISYPLYRKVSEDKSYASKAAQKKEMFSIYQNSVIGLLREGCPRFMQSKEVEKDGKVTVKESVVITVRDNSGKSNNYAIPTNMLKTLLQDEYDSVVGDGKGDSKSQNKEQSKPVSEKPASVKKDDTDWHDLPLFYDEPEEKDEEDFVYQSVIADVVSKEDESDARRIVFDVYPERIPRDKEDLIRTVVVVKGERNAIHIGQVAGTVTFNVAGVDLGTRVEVKPDGKLSVKTLNLSKDYNIDFKVTKLLQAKVKEKRNTHMLLKVSGEDVHIFPVQFNKNEEDGNAQSVALVGEENIALVPSFGNILPVTGKDGGKHNVRVYWRGGKLNSQI